MSVIFGGESAVRILYKFLNLRNQPRCSMPWDMNPESALGERAGHQAKDQNGCLTKADEVLAQAALIGIPCDKVYAVAASSGRRFSTSESVVFHTSPIRPNVPAYIDCGAFYVASPELCFLEMAADLDLIDLILLGYQFCGDYRKSRQDITDFKPLTTPEKLWTFLSLLPERTRGVHRAKEALRYVLPRSASPRESRVAIICILPHRLGGYNFPMPALNQPIPGTGKTGDICWLDRRFIIEYDSDEHHQGEHKRSSDSARSKIIGLYGNCTVMSLWTDETNDWALFDNAIRYAARQMNIRLRSARQLNKRSKDYFNHYKTLHFRLFRCRTTFEDIAVF